MPIQAVICGIICVTFFLQAFIAFFNPLKVNVIGNRWLSIFYVAVAGMALNEMLFLAGWHERYYRLIGASEMTRFAMAPALYLAVLQFTTPGNSFKVKQLWRFLPFALFVLYMAPTILLPGTHSWLLTHSMGVLVATFFGLTARFQLLAYWALSLLILYRHQKNIRHINSNIEPVSLDWLKYMMYAIGAMVILFVINVALHIYVHPLLSPMVYLSASLLIIYYSLAQKEIYPFVLADIEGIQLVIEEVNENSRTVKTRFTSEEALQLTLRLQQLMQIEKFYLDNELNLPQLAQAMDLSVHDLSYLLNEVIGVNFFQFVNGYRVEEAKQLMLSGKHNHLNILGIAYHAGFNSKTTFNTAFKKATGLSPSQYIKQSATLSDRLTIKQIGTGL